MTHFTHLHIPRVTGIMFHSEGNWYHVFDSASDELELLGGPGYELAKKNLDLMDSLMNEVHEFYENWERKLNDITDKHEEEAKVACQTEKVN